MYWCEWSVSLLLYSHKFVSSCLLTLVLCIWVLLHRCTGFPGGAVVPNLPTSAGAAGDEGSIPGAGRSPGEGNGNPFQYSCLDKNGQRSLLGYSPWGHKESDMTEQFTHTHTHTHTLLPYILWFWCLLLHLYVHPFAVHCGYLHFHRNFFLICVLVYLSDFLYNCDFLLSIDSYVFSI